MAKTIKIVKANSKWHVEFDVKIYPIKESDSGIMDILKPSDNQICIITDTSNEDALCYFLKEDGKLKIYTYPDEVLRIESTVDLGFFKKLTNGVKYYLIPVR